ncbi:MAG: C1 family peptidase [Prevotella sp.]
MKKFILVFAVIVALISCNERQPQGKKFVTERLNKFTPVKDQGRSFLCWAYAMLATIETDRLHENDSVNLSVAYAARSILKEQAYRMYFTQGKKTLSLRATAPLLLDVISRYGVVPYDVYKSDCNYNVVSRRMENLVSNAIAHRTGMQNLTASVEDMLDNAVGPAPHNVYLYGAQYTPLEFSHSVCQYDDYVALTSYTHLPFYKDIVLDVPDNDAGCQFYNVPIDTLMTYIERTVMAGYGVCWEGDISNAGFSFKSGLACLNNKKMPVTQATRQHAFETFKTTDDHCMEIVGIAHDMEGTRYFICKNSWGTCNPYGGLIYMSFEYARLNTIAVVMKRHAKQQ